MAQGNRTFISGDQHLQSFQDSTRPHYWFLAISSCGSSSRLEFQYELEFVNPGGIWQRQFSFDDQGLVGMYLFFWLFFTIVTVFHLKGLWTLIHSKSFHPIVRLLSASLVLETCSLLCFFIHFAVYASNGIGANGLRGLGEILDMSSQLAFMFLLILIAKGWAITRPQITGQKILLVVVSSFLIAYVSLFTWDNVGRDHASTLYIYESVPGIIILVLRVLTLGWFLLEIRKTFLEETERHKRWFYKLVGGIYSAWFMMLVLIVIIAVVVPGWDRAKVVTGMYLCMNCLGFSVLAFLFWPSRAIQYFQMSQSNTLLLDSSFQNSPYERL